MPSPARGCSGLDGAVLIPPAAAGELRVHVRTLLSQAERAYSPGKHEEEAVPTGDPNALIPKPHADSRNGSASKRSAHVFLFHEHLNPLSTEGQRMQRVYTLLWKQPRG